MYGNKSRWCKLPPTRRLIYAGNFHFLIRSRTPYPDIAIHPLLYLTRNDGIWFDKEVCNDIMVVYIQMCILQNCILLFLLPFPQRILMSHLKTINAVQFRNCLSIECKPFLYFILQGGVTARSWEGKFIYLNRKKSYHEENKNWQRQFASIIDYCFCF